MPWDHSILTKKSYYQLGKLFVSSSTVVYMITCSHRYRDVADEPDASDRVIVFSVSDGTLTSRSSISLDIATIDDNPTLVSTNGSGRYRFTEGNSPTLLEGILLDDEDAVNSDVTVENVTIEILDGAYNEILNISSTTPAINVSKDHKCKKAMS